MLSNHHFKQTYQWNITHAKHEMIEALIVDVLQRPLHGQREFHERRQVFPAHQDILVLLFIVIIKFWIPLLIKKKKLKFYFWLRRDV